MKIIKKSSYRQTYKEFPMVDIEYSYFYNNIAEYINEILNGLNNIVPYLDKIEELEEEIIENAKYSGREPGDDYYGRDYLSQSIPMKIKRLLSEEVLEDSDLAENFDTISNYYSYLVRLKKDQENGY